MAQLWPPRRIENEFGMCTVSLGDSKLHPLRTRLEEAAKAGYKWIDLFDECWAAYLESHGQDPDALWEPTQENLRIARKLGDFVKSLGMRIICTQPLRTIEGTKDPSKRAGRIELVTKRFPFMRAFDTEMVFMCTNIHKEPVVTTDFQTLVKDLREMSELAEAFSIKDGGPIIRIGYEALSWAQRNTWSSSWEIVRAVNRHNVGLIVDSFNLLAVEFADPYNPAGHGRIYPSLDESLDVIRLSLATLVATVPGDKIYLYQVADAERIDPKVYSPPTDPNIPRILPWSRGHRLYPLETDRGAYMPVDLVTAAILATGYKGPLSIEVFNDSLHEPDATVPEKHAKRGIAGLKKLVRKTEGVKKFWGTRADETEAYRIWKKRNYGYSNRL